MYAEFGDKLDLETNQSLQALAAALRAAGANSEFVEIPWGDHAFDALPGGLSGQLSLFYVERFLASVFSSAS